jgi:hypothetical protein
MAGRLCARRNENFSIFIEKENDSVPFRVISHHVEFALPFFHGKFLVADHENNRLSLIFLIDKRSRELEFGRRLFVRERSFRATGRQISAG